MSTKIKQPICVYTRISNPQIHMLINMLVENRQIYAHENNWFIEVKIWYRLKLWYGQCIAAACILYLSCFVTEMYKIKTWITLYLAKCRSKSCLVVTFGYFCFRSGDQFGSFTTKEWLEKVIITGLSREPSKVTLVTKGNNCCSLTCLLKLFAFCHWKKHAHSVCKTKVNERRLVQHSKALSLMKEDQQGSWF